MLLLFSYYPWGIVLPHENGGTGPPTDAVEAMQPDTTPDSDTIQFRAPKALTSGLRERAREAGFYSVSEFMRHLVRQELRAGKETHAA